MKMKTVMFYAPLDLRIDEVEIPEPGPGEVVIETKATLTCGTDVKRYRRGYPIWDPPYPLGHEVSGVVYRADAEVTGFKEGDRVAVHNTAVCGSCFYCKQGNFSLCPNYVHIPGTFAKYVRIPRRIVEQNMFVMPEQMSFRQAALLEPLACAVYGVEQSNVRIGNTVVVNGAGPIGLMMARLCKLKGARVIICDVSARRLEIAERLGVDERIQVTEGLDQVAAVRSLTEDGRGVDVAIEAVGLPKVWEMTIAMARKGGLVNLFGGCKDGTSITIDTKLLHYSQLTIKGVLHTTPQNVLAAFELLKIGEFKETDFITGEYPIEKIIDALEDHASGKGLKNAILVN